VNNEEYFAWHKRASEEQKARDRAEDLEGKTRAKAITASFAKGRRGKQFRDRLAKEEKDASKVA